MSERQPILTADLDLYKLTMGDLAYHEHFDTDVTFTLNNRGLAKGQRIADVVSPEMLSERLDAVRDTGLQQFEAKYLNELKGTDGERLLTPDYVSFLSSLRLPEVPVSINPATGELDAWSRDKLPKVSLWETTIMTELSELYGERMLEKLGISKTELFNEANRKLTDKINYVKQYPQVTFADFGTRRRFSYDWQEHYVERLATELPEQFTGTSNPLLAHKFGIKVVGTYAHEDPMIYAAKEYAQGGSPLDGERKFLSDWERFQRGTLMIALPDTFTTESFFNGFTAEQAKRWAGYRQDSGDPIVFANRVIDFLERSGVDPKSKFILPSDALTYPKMVEIAQQLEGRIGYTFGIGSNNSNDVHDAVKPLNIVVKATEVNGYPTVKLSDDPGKHTGSPEIVAEYQDFVARRNALAAHATRSLVQVS